VDKATTLLKHAKKSVLVHISFRFLLTAQLSPVGSGSAGGGGGVPITIDRCRSPR